jgi:GNAT superfamily N-acetyltransferase
MPTDVIEQLTHPVPESDLRDLALLLIDAVDSGAAVSFLAPLPLEVAREWWQKTLAGAHPKAVVLVARDASGIIGSVQLHPAWAPNQPHRADIAKLLVHRRARGNGLGRALMLAIEQAALESGFTLLTLDAKRGGVADHLYQRLGWQCVGIIPRFALDTDGRALHDDVIFYKHLVSVDAR